MNIIILGAGRVGESVAESLASEQNDITVIDQDPDRLRLLEDRLDLRGVVGNGIQPSVLREAGAQDADMLIACAAADESNLVVCKVAHDVFNVPTTIARLRSPEFVEGDALMSRSGFAVDHVICPEESVTRYIHQLIDYPEALQVLSFAEGRACLIAVRAVHGGALVGHTLADMRERLPNAEMRVVAIYRQDAEVDPGPQTRILAGDEVFVLADQAKIRLVLAAIHRADRSVQRVMIAGGGKVGLRLARNLAGQCQVKLIERDRKRCDYLASQLPSSMLVLHGDGTDEELLQDENVGEMDLFLALSSDDEDNILAAMLAKRLGANRVISLINRRAYADMMQGSTIDIAISPSHTVIGELLAHLRRGDVAQVHSLRRGAAEAIEGIARGDLKTSRLVGRRVEEIKLPSGARIGVIVRGEGDASQVLMPHHDTLIEADDHIVIFIPHKRMVREVERLFQVGATFFEPPMTTLLPVLAVMARIQLAFALSFLVPLGWAWTHDSDAVQRVWLGSLLLALGAGLALWQLTRRHRRELMARDGFLLVNLVWLVLPAFAAVPLMYTVPDITWTKAYFEAMSALTATGATALSGLDTLPVATNIWRCFLQLIGGLGIMLLVVAVLPLLGLGGVQLYKAETPGPMKDTKFTPRIAETARGLWGVYFLFAVLCMLAYRWAGMSWPDAFMHMCTTMGLGGFSSHDASFGHWDSPLIEAVAVVFMTLAGISFVRYFMVLRTRSLRPVLGDREIRTYLLVLAGSVALLTLLLLARGVYTDFFSALRASAFHVVSVATTTGYASTDYAQWPAFAPIWLIFLGCFVSCAGSTGGGIKMVRMVLLVKQARRELVRIIHPRVVNPVTLGRNVLPSSVMTAVLGFMLIYGACTMGLTMLLLFSGLDIVTAFSAVVATLNNIGPGLGEVGPAGNFGGLTAFQMWVCTFAMLLGRLELLSVLVLFTGHFWRK